MSILHTISNIDRLKNEMSSLHGKRKTSEPQLWVYGCSITVASGIPDHCKYYNLVNEVFGFQNITVVAENSSSIPWSADQILRSDLLKGDIVIWGLTSRYRFPYFLINKLIHVRSDVIAENKHLQKVINLDAVACNDNLYRSYTNILQVINFCKKLGVKLYICGMLSDKDFDQLLLDHTEYISAGVFNGVEDFIDFAPDKMHPGIQQHKKYAELILKNQK